MIFLRNHIKRFGYGLAGIFINSFRIFWSDIKQGVRNPMMMIILIGMIILPSLYAWVNILASTDPYTSTDGIKISVVNLDEGGSLFDKEINIGDSVIDQLHDNDKMGWTFYDTREAAVQSVINADSYAAIVVPEDFSADICTMFQNPTKPNLEYYVNQKTNAIAPKMTGAAVQTLQEGIKQQIISTVVETIYDELNIVGDNLDNNSDKIRKALDMLYDSESIINEIPAKVSDYRDRAKEVLDTVEDKKAQVAEVTELLENTQDLITDLTGDIRDLDKKITEYEPDILQAMKDAEAVAEDINDVSNALLEVHNYFQSIISNFDKLSNFINSLMNALLEGNDVGSILTDIRDTSREIAVLLQDVRTTLYDNVFPKVHHYLDDTYDIAYDALDQIDTGLEEIDAAMALVDTLLDKGNEALGHVDNFLTDYPDYANRIIDVIDKVKKLDENIDINTVISLLMANGEDEGNFFADPVVIEEQDFFPTANYGAAMTPFYTTLCLWVGAVILCAILTTDAKNAAFPFTRRQEYFGKWLLFVLLGILQGLMVALGNIFLLKIEMVHPALFVLISMYFSLIFVTIVFSFVFQFGNVGKAIAVILLVLQIAGAGGTFPIECTPQFFQNIYGVIPFTYAINAMREAVAGVYTPNLLFDLEILTAYLVIFLAIGLISKHWIKKITVGAQKKMSKSGLTE